MTSHRASHWVGTWAATPAPAEGVALSSPTIRMFPRISVGGDTIRVRLSNAAGTGDLVIGATHVAKRGAGATLRDMGRADDQISGAGGVRQPHSDCVAADADAWKHA